MMTSCVASRRPVPMCWWWTQGWGQSGADETMLTDDVSGQTLEFGVDTAVPVIDDIDGDMRYGYDINDAAIETIAFSFDAFDDEGLASE